MDLPNKLCILIYHHQMHPSQPLYGRMLHPDVTVHLYTCNPTRDPANNPFISPSQYQTAITANPSVYPSIEASDWRTDYPTVYPSVSPSWHTSWNPFGNTWTSTAFVESDHVKNTKKQPSAISGNILIGLIIATVVMTCIFVASLAINIIYGKKKKEAHVSSQKEAEMVEGQVDDKHNPARWLNKVNSLSENDEDNVKVQIE
eukprot:111165_1